MKLFFELPEGNVLINKKAIKAVFENDNGCYILMSEPKNKYYTTSLNFEEAKTLFGNVVPHQSSKIDFNPLYHKVVA